MDSPYIRKSRGLAWPIIIGAVVLVGLSFWLLFTRVGTMGSTVSLGAQTYRVEVARTNEQRATGLSNHSSLGDREAMLFIFDEEDYYAMWMKGMAFAIDIIWLDAQREVVHIERDVQPDSEPHRRYSPMEPALYVLEVAAGQAAGVSVGDAAVFGGVE